MALAVGGLVVRPFASGGSNVGGPAPVTVGGAPPSPARDDLGLPAMQRTCTSPSGMAMRSRIPRTGPRPARLIQEGGGRHAIGGTGVRPSTHSTTSKARRWVRGSGRPPRCCRTELGGRGRLDRRVPHLFERPRTARRRARIGNRSASTERRGASGTAAARSRRPSSSTAASTCSRCSLARSSSRTRASCSTPSRRPSTCGRRTPCSRARVPDSLTVGARLSREMPQARAH